MVPPRAVMRYETRDRKHSNPSGFGRPSTRKRPTQPKEHTMTLLTQTLTPVRLGRYTLSNRLVMSPMTRSRAKPDGTPGELAAKYYAQRASVGLIVTEGTQPSDEGQGYPTTPGIYTAAHIAGWKKVTTAVHGKGCRIFIQLMHVGRMSHPDNTPQHRQRRCAVGNRAGVANVHRDGNAEHADAARTIDRGIRQTRRRLPPCGTRGNRGRRRRHRDPWRERLSPPTVLAPNANTRTDQYGGSIENRARFGIEVAAAVAEEIGADRTAIRLSPDRLSAGIDEGTDGPDLYRYLVAQLDKLGLAYIHVIHNSDEQLMADLREQWKQALILNRPGRPRDQIGADVASGFAELEAYGQMILANPDFVIRLKSDAPMNEADRITFFGGDARGYTDYPALEASAA